MLAAFPDAARITIPPEWANKLLRAAESLPLYDNKEFYSTALQAHVLKTVREFCPESFDSVINMIKERIARRPYCALVHGLQFDEGNRLFVAINRSFGELVARPYEKPRAQLVHYVQPATDIYSSRGGHESERLHTDTADWEPPVEMISMICVRADRAGGGRSRVLDIDSVRDEVEKLLGFETLKRLETEPVPWQIADYLGGGVKWRTVLATSRMCWRRYTINLALDSKGGGLSQEMREALDAFEEVISTTPLTIDFLMGEGDLLVSDNIRTIHARTPITDGALSDRLMIRSWIRAA